MHRKCRRCEILKPIDRYPTPRSLICKVCKARKQRSTPQSKEYQRDWRLKSRYGITIEQYETVLREQNGKCAGCLGVYTSYVVDHNHACCSGKKTCGKCIRGLLCNGCNTALGFTKDSPATLRSLANYLENFQDFSSLS